MMGGGEIVKIQDPKSPSSADSIEKGGDVAVQPLGTNKDKLQGPVRRPSWITTSTISLSPHRPPPSVANKPKYLYLSAVF